VSPRQLKQRPEVILLLASLASKMACNFIYRDVAEELKQVAAAKTMSDPTVHAVDTDDLARLLGFGKRVQSLRTR